MSASGRDALGDLQKRSGGTLECLVVVWRPSRMSGSDPEPYRLSGSGRDALGDVREWS